MSFVPRSCAHCGAGSFQVVPGVQLEIWEATKVFGIQASQVKSGGSRWTFTLVICEQCGRTETFTANTAEVAALYEGSQRITTTRPA